MQQISKIMALTENSLNAPTVLLFIITICAEICEFPSIGITHRNQKKKKKTQKKELREQENAISQKTFASVKKKNIPIC